MIELIRSFISALLPVLWLIRSVCVCAIAAGLSFLWAAQATAGMKVAFTADQGTGEDSIAVLELIRDEGADLLMLQGDFGYERGAAAIWANELDSVLGEDFPILGVVGNHENFEWLKYKRFLQQRLDRISGLSCEGDSGVKAHCKYANVEIVQVSPGIYEVDGVAAKDGYADYITERFAQSTAPWRICAWHKNQGRMQAGTKKDSVGWEVYEACRKAGAIIATGHDHSYARSFLLNDMENTTVEHRGSTMKVEPGKTFVFVSGLGGIYIRPQVRFDDWWASVYSATQNASNGALFCDFDEATAECYFKDVNGGVPDIFALESGHEKLRVDGERNSAVASVVADDNMEADHSSDDGFIATESGTFDTELVVDGGVLGLPNFSTTAVNVSGHGVQDSVSVEINELSYTPSINEHIESASDQSELDAEKLSGLSAHLPSVGVLHLSMCFVFIVILSIRRIEQDTCSLE